MSPFLIRVTASGYHPRLLEVNGTDDVQELRIAIDPFLFRLAGAVLDGTTGGPIANATVRARPGSAFAQTGAAGSYNLSLPNGTFELVTSAPGYGDRTQSVTVAGSATSSYVLLGPATPVGSKSGPGGGSPTGPGETLIPPLLSPWGLGLIAAAMAAVSLGGLLFASHHIRRRRSAWAREGFSLATLPAPPETPDEEPTAHRPEPRSRRRHR